MTIAHLKQLFRGSIVSVREEKKVVEKFMKKLSIKAPSMDTKIRNLSGGNQQKVVVAKWLVKSPRILIMDEPTRGIDVGAKYEIYTLMRELTKQGLSIIMISSELIEIIGMCDRCLVVGNGKAAGILERSELTEEKVMRLATV
jgi:ABC-type sugar transport system ATPase subunit